MFDKNHSNVYYIQTSHDKHFSQQFPHFRQLYERELQSQELKERQLEEGIQRLEQSLYSFHESFKSDFNENKENNNLFTDQLIPRFEDKLSEEEEEQPLRQNTPKLNDCFVKVVKNDIKGYKPVVYHLNQTSDKSTKARSDSNEDKSDQYFTRIGHQFKCLFNGCDKRYRHLSYIRSHIRGHTKPFKCPQKGCLKTFARSCDLKKHMTRYHRFSPNMVYNQCKQVFRTKFELSSHQINSHLKR